MMFISLKYPEAGKMGYIKSQGLQEGRDPVPEIKPL
jgi:hypothetical protein